MSSRYTLLGIFWSPESSMSTKQRVNGPKWRGQKVKAQSAEGLAEVARATKHHLSCDQTGSARGTPVRTVSLRTRRAGAVRDNATKGPASVPASGAHARQYRDSVARLHVLRLSEVLAHLHTMSRASRRQHARIQLKAGHFDQAELRLRMAA